MSHWRDIKERARKQVHEAFSYRATYYAPGSITPIPCNARRTVARKALDVGDLGGLSGIGNAGFASTIERSFDATFLRSELPNPQRGGRIEFEDGMVFRIETVLPDYGQTVTVEIEPV